MQNLRASVKNVHFAGEATSFEYYGSVPISCGTCYLIANTHPRVLPHSYLQGAYFEGLARGRSIAKCIIHGGKYCNGKEGKEVINANMRYPEEDDLVGDESG